VPEPRKGFLHRLFAGVDREQRFPARPFGASELPGALLRLTEIRLFVRRRAGRLTSAGRCRRRERSKIRNGSYRSLRGEISRIRTLIFGALIIQPHIDGRGYCDTAAWEASGTDSGNSGPRFASRYFLTILFRPITGAISLFEEVDQGQLLRSAVMVV
jgi:hypothetical protein